MKAINDFINEARETMYRVSFVGLHDEDDLPISVNILVEKEYAKIFEKFLKDEKDNIFIHADGANIEF